jgi:hypothetical protein
MTDNSKGEPMTEPHTTQDSTQDNVQGSVGLTGCRRNHTRAA